MGKPPIKPEIVLPTPCANNSLLVLVTLLSGSKLSTASILNKVSKLAIIAIIKPYIITVLFVKPLKLGNVKKLKNSVGDFAIDKFTKCELSII